MWRRTTGIFVILIVYFSLVMFTSPAQILAQTQPDLVEVEPAAVTNDTANPVRLVGTSFEDPPVVMVGGETLSDVTWLSAEQVQAVLPQGFAAGVYSVTITNPGGLNDTLPEALSVQNPAPVIEIVSPTSIPNDINTNLAITGSNFVAPVAVQVGEQAIDEISVVSATQVEAVLPWGWDPGVYDVQVTNPGPGSPSVTLTEAVTVTQAFGVWTTGGPYGGDAIGVYVHPDDENLVFASMRDVGLFRSADGGANWQKVFPEHPFVFAVAPSDHNLIYQSWVILHKSTDGGLTWTPIYNEASKLLMGEAKAFLVHPTDPDQLYVGIPAINTVNSGFFYSSDGGVTWNHKENGMTHNSVAGAVFHPDNPQHIFLVTTDGYLYETTDGADNWTELGRPFDQFNFLAIDPFGEHDLWAGYCPDDYYSPHGVARAAQDGLNSWESIPIMEVTGWCVNADVTFDPTKDGTIYVSSHTLAYKTTDGGESWLVGLSDSQQLMGFALSPANSDMVYARHMGKGIKKSNDGGMTWEAVNNGLAGVVPWAMAASNHNPDEVYVGSNPYGLYWSDSGGHTWLERAEYSGSNCLATDVYTPGRVYSTAYNGIHISADHGLTWFLSDFNPEVPDWCDTCVGGSTSLGLGSHPGVPGRILAGIGFLFLQTPEMYWPGMIAISTDYGVTWNAAQGPAPCGVQGEFAFSLTDPNRVYAAGAIYKGCGGLLRSLDGGFTWEDITPEFAILPATLTVHPTDPLTVFITSYYSVYRSTDGGGTWTKLVDIQGSMDMLYANSNLPVLYLGGAGLRTSYDNGATWQRAAGALGYAGVRKLAFAQDADRSVLYVGTAGEMGAESTSSLNAEDTEAAAGVYRNAQVIYHFRLYLPFVRR